VSVVGDAAGALGLAGPEVQFAEAAVVHGVVKAAEHSQGRDRGEDPREHREVTVFDLRVVSGCRWD
jgi:hypothetical protein